MEKSGFSWTRCSRRQFLILMLFQLTAVGFVFTLLQCLTADITLWLPRSIGQEWELSGAEYSRTYNIQSRGDEGREMKGEKESPPHFARNNRSEGGQFMPYQNDLTRMLLLKNQEPPRNRDLFPKLADDHIPIVLYVHNRPQYLQVVVDSLAQVRGIEETLLIVSHDGYFPQMNAIVESIRFCRVKQIFALFSPHLFNDSFPGEAPEDCQGQEDPSVRGCIGNPDQYGNHRTRRIVSLKHHWWWMMNTVWDGLVETRNHNGNILFIEEDHFLLPNAYRSIEMLRNMNNKKCPECVGVSLAPMDVNSRGEGHKVLVVEKIGNVGYSFNRTVFSWIRDRAGSFCKFDDYNWDITMWAVVFPFFPNGGYALRGPRASAMHFGKCGLHQGQEKGKPLCVDDNSSGLPVTDEDIEPFLSEDWRVLKFPIRGYNKGFEGWGGWGDKRDHQLCLDFSTMYHTLG